MSTIRFSATGVPALAAHGVYAIASSAGGGGGGGGSPSTMALTDFVTFWPGIQPIVQRTGRTTAANVPIVYEFTGTAPGQPQGQVVSTTGAVIVDWTNLINVTNLTASGQGFVPGVPLGINYLIKLRDGLEPSNTQTQSTGTTPFGVGLVYSFQGQSNMVGILGASFARIVPGSSLNEWDYFNSFIGTGKNGAVFDDAGWHADGGQGQGPFGTSSVQFASANTCMFVRIMAAALSAQHGAPIPVGIIPWALNATSIGQFLPTASTQLGGNAGSSGTTMGFRSPLNVFCGDFEGFFWHQGEADAASSPSVVTTYSASLQALCQGCLTQVAQFGRTPADFLFAPAILGNYGIADDGSGEPFIEYIRQAEMSFIAGANAGTLPGQSEPWPNVDCGCNCIDMSTGAGLHFISDAVTTTGMRRFIQSALKFAGVSGNGPAGVPFGGRGPILNTSPTVSSDGLTITFTVEHEGGTALTLPTPGSPPTGFYLNTAVDFSGTMLAPTSVALINSNTEIQIVMPSGTATPYYCKYMGGLVGSMVVDSLGFTASCNPDFTNAIYDNVTYPTGTIGTDIDPLGLPLQPTNGAITIQTGPAASMTVQSVSPLAAGSTSTASLAFANGTPTGLTAMLAGAALTISDVIIGSGTASFEFTCPDAGTYALVVTGMGTGAVTPSYSVTTVDGATFGGNSIPKVAYAQVHSLTNASAAAVAAPYSSTNHQFAAGDIPAGSYPAVYDVTGTTEQPNYQIDYTRTWDGDGSLRQAVISRLHTETFDANGGTNQTFSYVVKPKVGNLSSAPNVTLADIQAQDIKVVFSGLDCGSDQFQVRVNDIIANSGPGLYVASLPTSLLAASGAETLTFASLSKSVTGSTGVVSPFSVGVGMQVTVAGVPTGTYVKSRTGDTVTLSAPLTSAIASGTSVGFDSPVYGYEAAKVGAACSEWSFWSRLCRVSDGAVHYWVMGTIFLKAWAATGQWEISFHCCSPNCYGPHPTGSVGTILPPGAAAANTNPIPRFIVASAILMNGTSPLVAWGGPTDFRVQDIEASTFGTAVGTMTWPATRYNTAFGFTDFVSGQPLTFAADSGSTLPSGVQPNTVYFVNQNTSANYAGVSDTYTLCTDRVDVFAGGGVNLFPAEQFCSEGFYYGNASGLWKCTVGGNIASATGPTGATGATVIDGAATFVKKSVDIGTAGAGTVKIIPAVGVWSGTGWSGLDPVWQPVWWQGAGSLATRPNLLFSPPIEYLTTASTALPPMRQSTPTVVHDTLDFGFLEGPPGITNQNTLSINCAPPWGWSIRTQGDNPPDMRVGDISPQAAWLLRVPTDANAAQIVRSNAYNFTERQTWWINERSGFPLIANMGPGRIALPPGEGSNYPGLGNTDPGYTTITNNEWPTDAQDDHNASGYAAWADYGLPSDGEHLPRPVWVPFVLDGSPHFLHLLLACATGAMFANSSGGASFNNYQDKEYAQRHYITVAGQQLSGVVSNFGAPIRAIAWTQLVQLRMVSALPSAHPMLPYYEDMSDDSCKAFFDYFVTRADYTGFPTQSLAFKAMGWIDDGIALNNPNNPAVYQSYMNNYLSWAWSTWSFIEQNNRRNNSPYQLIQQFLRIAAIDFWDSDINPWRSEYYAGGLGPNSGFGYPISDTSTGVMYSTVAATYAAAGWTAVYPTSAPATNVGINDPALPLAVGVANAYITPSGQPAGRGAYPYDCNNYYTTFLASLALLAQAGIPKANTLYGRTYERILGLLPDGITWALADDAGYSGGHNDAFWTFDAQPPPLGTGVIP